MRPIVLAMAAVLCLLPVRMLAAPDITVLGLFPGMAVLQVDGTRYTLRVGQATPEGVKLLKADSATAELQVQGERRRVSLGSPAVSTRYEPPESRVAKILPTRGMYLVDGTINRQPVRFLVDTGASWVAMGPRHAKRLGIDFRKGAEAWANTASGVAKVYEITLDRVRVGEIELRSVKAAVIEGDMPTDAILLGMSFLGRLEMQREGGVLQLRQKY